MLHPGTASAGGAGPTFAGHAIGDADPTRVRSSSLLAPPARPGIADCGADIGATPPEGAGSARHGEGGSWDRGKRAGPHDVSCGGGPPIIAAGGGGCSGQRGATTRPAHQLSSWGRWPSFTCAASSSPSAPGGQGSDTVLAGDRAMAAAAEEMRRRGNKEGSCSSPWSHAAARRRRWVHRARAAKAGQTVAAAGPAAAPLQRPRHVRVPSTRSTEHPHRSSTAGTRNRSLVGR